ncbi:MAG TPA: hypothetical protein VGQ81_07400 [Acidobacteriota bacterium]|nr:hypothetical protein [Acidobacteriota bacterium]
MTGLVTIFANASQACVDCPLNPQSEIRNPQLMQSAIRNGKIRN